MTTGLLEDENLFQGVYPHVINYTDITRVDNKQNIRIRNLNQVFSLNQMRI